jgi:plastocyanin
VYDAHRRKLAILTTLFVAACGGGSGDDDGDDAPDAAAGDVVSVSCAGATIAQEITTSGFNFSPVDSTISVGDIVHFTPTTGHDVQDSGGAFSVSTGGDACFRFDAADSYTFTCTIHGFSGSLTVQ